MTPFEIEQVRIEREQAIANDELNAWIDSQLDPKTAFLPCCGQCQHFDSRGIDVDGIRGICRAKVEYSWNGRGFLTVHPRREATDQPCDRYSELVPF
jgi:hypothetical protein